MAKDAVYRRMWEVSVRRGQAAPYNRLSLADRRAIVEILRETKKGLPDYFQPVRSLSWAFDLQHLRRNGRTHPVCFVRGI